MSDKLTIPDEVVISKIYYIRDQKVMLDIDLAELYEVETRVLNQQVKRNIDRFPDDFMFQMTEVEWETLKLQNTTSIGLFLFINIFSMSKANNIN
jgi:hypothetical protein